MIAPALLAVNWSDDSVVKLAVGIGVPALTTVVSFIAGRFWGYYRARRQWSRKDFLGRIIISLNLFNDNKLRIRTITERTLEEIFPNAVAVDMIRSAAQRTTVDNPLMPIAKEDSWFLLNFVLNHVAEHFTRGLVKMDAGLPVTKVVYGLFLTCELVGEERIRKVRALMLRKDLLENFPYMETMPELENPWHADRIVTLRRAVETYRKNPEQFLFLEVCV